MLTRRHTALACLALGLLAPALRADEPKIEGDLKKLQGTWTSKDDQGESTWLFQGNKLSLKTPNRAYQISITLDPQAKPIPTIDFKTDPNSPNAPDYMAQGIYKFDGDKKLFICFGDAQAGRPKEFKMEFGTSFLFELTAK
jgi:uncharacterized protein (TIGR03067 family)